VDDGRPLGAPRAEARGLRSDAGLVQPGDVLQGRWEIERVIGTGGMGTVVAARHLGLGHRVAIKILVSKEEDARERFEREARAMATLESKHTVRVHDVDLDGEAPFMVMDYLEGTDLAHLGEGALPSVIDTCLWMEQACDALAEAHAKGIVHRDIKPHNLFLAKNVDGTSSIRVLDFGIALRTSGDGADMATLTKTGAVVGTLAYMAPEQIRSSKQVDARTDLWSVGACLYRILTGTRPFDGKNEIDIVEGILFKEAPPLSALRRDVPPAVEAVVAKCLRKNPDERFRSARELAAALAAARAAPSRSTAPMPPQAVAAARARGPHPLPLRAPMPSYSVVPSVPSRAPMPSYPMAPTPPPISVAPQSSLPPSNPPVPSTVRPHRPPSAKAAKPGLPVGVVVAFAIALALFLSGVALAALTAFGRPH